MFFDEGIKWRGLPQTPQRTAARKYRLLTLPNGTAIVRLSDWANLYWAGKPSLFLRGLMRLPYPEFCRAADEIFG